MRLFNLAAVALIVWPIALTAGSATAATAHNSQAGGIGQSSDANASTVNSRRVKHSAKHMHKAM